MSQEFNSVLNFNNGRHMTIDALVENGKTILNNPGLGNILLEDIIEKIDMTMILPPITVKFPHAVCEMNRILEVLEKDNLQDSQTYKLIKNTLLNRKLQTYGYSTIVIIAESHLSLHTFPEDNYFTFDCYSCKYFDDKEVLKVFEKHMLFMKSNVNVIKRGLE